MERNAREREWRAMLKKAHMCRDCKQVDAYTLAGRTRCAICAEQNAAAARKWREAHPGENAKNMKVRMKHWQSENRCQTCGKPLVDSRYKSCTECRARWRNYKANRRTTNYPRGENGICWQCNKQPVKEGFHLCPDCYTAKTALCSILNDNRNNRNHIWRKYNDRDQQKGQAAHCPGD